ELPTCDLHACGSHTATGQVTPGPSLCREPAKGNPDLGSMPATSEIPYRFRSQAQKNAAAQRRDVCCTTAKWLRTITPWACSTAVSAGDSSQRCLRGVIRGVDGMNSGNPSGSADGNPEPSRRYTAGRCRDYLRAAVPLMTGVERPAPDRPPGRG